MPPAIVARTCCCWCPYRHAHRLTPVPISARVRWGGSVGSICAEHPAARARSACCQPPWRPHPAPSVAHRAFRTRRTRPRPRALPASELNCPGPGRRRRRLGRPQAASGRSLPSISIAWQIHADATPSLSAVVETPIRRRQTPLAGPRAPLLPAASLHCRRPGQLGVWKPALPPLTEANCSALPAAVEVSAIGETPSPSRSARSQSEKRRLRVDSKARAPTRRPGPGGQRPESRQSRAAGALSPPLRRFRHSGHSTAPAGCGHARVRVLMFSQAGRLPVPASCGAAPVGSLSSISLGAASDLPVGT